MYIVEIEKAPNRFLLELLTLYKFIERKVKQSWLNIRRNKHQNLFYQPAVPVTHPSASNSNKALTSNIFKLPAKPIKIQFFCCR